MSSTPPEPYSAQTPAPGPRWRRRPSRRRVALSVAVVLVAAGVALAEHGAGGYYELSPGDAPLVTASAQCQAHTVGGNLTLPGGEPCARLVVPAGRGVATDGRLYMVDVLEGPASPVDYALSELGLLDTLRPGHQLVAAAEILGTTPASQLACQDTQEMTDATQAAAVAALDRLGYQVGVTQVGARVTQVNPGSAAAAAGVHCNDLITAVGATPVHTSSALGAAIHAERPGSEVTVTVQRPGSSGALQAVTLHATLTGVPAMPAVDGAPATPAQPTNAFLGVATMDDDTFTLPVDVSIDVGDIGGPSAGLALTLGLLDVLSQGHLTGGHPVAATGTISPDGEVGDVGGVAQKTVAVHHAGAQLFLVPPQELAVARGHASGMKVEAVSTLAQAIADLQVIGGTLTPPATGTTAAPAG